MVRRVFCSEGLLTIAAIALLHGPGLAVGSAGWSSRAISVVLRLLGVGVLLGAVGVVLAVAALGVVPQALVLAMSVAVGFMGSMASMGSMV